MNLSDLYQSYSDSLLRHIKICTKSVLVDYVISNAKNRIFLFGCKQLQDFHSGISPSEEDNETCTAAVALLDKLSTGATIDSSTIDSEVLRILHKGIKTVIDDFSIIKFVVYIHTQHASKKFEHDHSSAKLAATFASLDVEIENIVTELVT